MRTKLAAQRRAYAPRYRAQYRPRYREVVEKLARPLLALSLSLLGGCDFGARGISESRAIASVDGHEISLLQLRSLKEMANSGLRTPQSAEREVDALIDEELLLQQALKNRLERDPEVTQAIDQARRKILVRAYAERAVFRKEPISLAQQEEYYRTHPELFSDRKTFLITAFTLEPFELSDNLVTEVKRARSIARVRDLLERYRVRFSTERMQRTSEQLPRERLTAFAKSRPGDVQIVPDADGRVALMCIVRAENTPIAFERAKPVIEQLLITARNAEAIEQYLRQARAKAKIIYFNGRKSAAPEDAGMDEAKYAHTAENSPRAKSTTP